MEDTAFAVTLPTNERDLRARLKAAEDTLRAIRANEVDALVIGPGGKEEVRTLGGVDEPYRIFVEAMGQGAATIGDDGTILYCNTAFARLLEIPIDQLLGSSIYQYVSSDDEGLLRALLWEALTGSAKRDFNLLLNAKKSIPVHFTANPLKLEGTNLICLLATDLTEHYALLAAQAEASQARQAADELRHARDVADATNRAKDQFLAVLSHELRTPLSPAVLILSALADHPGLPADVREDLAMVHRNIELETRLIDDLLDLSRVINGKLNLRAVATSAHGVLRQAMQLCAAEAEEKGIRLSAYLTAGNDIISADTARLQQVFWNLLKNAIKFSPEGAQIEIRSENIQSKDDPQGKLRIRFIDIGIGIAGEHLTAIFNAFEQTDSAIAHRFGGLG